MFTSRPRPLISITGQTHDGHTLLTWMHGRPVAVHLHGSGRGGHHAHHVHAASHARGQRGVLHRPHSPVWPERAGPPLPLVALDGGLEVVRVGEAVVFTLDRVQVLCVPANVVDVKVDNRIITS